MNKVFILSYKPTFKDTRVQNQIRGLRNDYEVNVIELKKFNKYKKIKFRFYLFRYKKSLLKRLFTFDQIKNLFNIIFKNILLKYFYNLPKKYLNSLPREVKIILRPISIPIRMLIMYFIKILRPLIRYSKRAVRLFVRYSKRAVRLFVRYSKRVARPLVRYFKKFYRIVYNYLITKNDGLKLVINFFVINNLLIKKTNKLKKKPDVILANDLLTLPTAIFFKFKSNAKIIYDMHEYELDRVPKSTVIKKSFIYLLEEITIPFADYVTTVSYSIKKYYKKRFNKKIFLILNSPQKKNESKEEKTLKKIEKKKGFICIGNISYGRNIMELVQLSNKEKFDLTFMGDVNDKFNIDTNFFDKVKKSHYVNYLKAVEPEKITDVMLQFQSSIFLYDISFKNYDYALPNKFLLSIIYRKPIVCFRSTELELFQKRHNIKLNLINKLDELYSIKLESDSINENELNFYSKDRQIKALKKIINNLLLR